MRSHLQPWIARALSSKQLLRGKRWLAERRRRYRRQPHCLQVFIKVDDPYSYLLLQALREFEQRYRAEFQYYIVSRLSHDMFPEPELWHNHAFRDAAHVARLYAFDYPDSIDQQPEAVTEAVAAHLLSLSEQADFCQRAVTVLGDYWTGQYAANNRFADPAPTLDKNDRLLVSLGHYYSAMIHYNGEWYWGVDRLSHLEQRLNDLGLAANSSEDLVYDQSYRLFCQRLPLSDAGPQRPTTPLRLFFSARSPYSYLGLERTVKLARHYQIPLEIKPVLPMMMRGMNVPSAKKWYIFHDTKREARRLGIDYGFVADPLGPAVERCYALFEYACAEGKEIDYLLSFARGVNAQGIRAETDTGLQRIVERCGLNWSTAKPLLKQNSWRDWVEDNYAQMHQLGLWGVPCLQYGELVVWGQDRIDVIEQAICRAIVSHNSQL
ncbi:DsbA family protein [Aestuariirhabdus sp. Z084]|uniref:DsbA family protein n=1 Tax=Aestuariirhabdus haliotis TaxID=2918751 RepID=UPI00201B41DA|nr:DsbA family protein [Aestuariirhabdus haliotis]MCL6417134.1 DsbA family protein [Aestuariirhabdus haliotis]MCL6421084.1 DsbA family protein [Aestuariirhabdus haliotis]